MPRHKPQIPSPGPKSAVEITKAGEIPPTKGCFDFGDTGVAFAQHDTQQFLRKANSE